MLHDRDELIRFQQKKLSSHFKMMMQKQSKETEIQGIIPALFSGDLGLSKNTFLVSLRDDGCSWIFDVDKIKAKHEMIVGRSRAFTLESAKNRRHS